MSVSEYPAAAFLVSDQMWPVIPRRIFLVHASFEEQAGPGSEPKPLPDSPNFIAELFVYRLSALGLGVALALSLGGERVPYNFRVMYAGEFFLPDSTPPEKIEQVWHHVALDSGPQLLYPYVRQAVSDLTGRSRAETVTLPFLSLPLEPPADFVIPSAPDETGQVEIELSPRQGVG